MRQKSSPKNLAFGKAIFAEVIENECIDGRHLRDNEYIQFGAQQ